MRSRLARTLALIASLLAMLTLTVGVATTASAKPRTAVDPSAVAMTGSVIGDPATTFNGTFDVTRFVVEDGQLLAEGTLNGVLGTTTIDPTVIQLPVNLDQSSGTCKILHLELGPLDLELLGLQVHLDKVVLDIEAQSGPGNLLGNLLCAVAGLLDGNTGLNAILTQIANLLNQLLGVLR